MFRREKSAGTLVRLCYFLSSCLDLGAGSRQSSIREGLDDSKCVTQEVIKNIAKYYSGKLDPRCADFILRALTVSAADQAIDNSDYDGARNILQKLIDLSPSDTVLW